MDDLSYATTPAQPELPRLLSAAEEALDMLHDRIDVLYERTAGVRVPRPTSPALDADKASYGAYHLDRLGNVVERLVAATRRVELVLSELEV